MPDATSIDTFAMKVAGLTSRFDRYREQYRRDGFDESTLRLEYLNPFFKALGWDVDNDQGHPPHLREVRVEYPTADGTSNRRADYVFRIGGMDRFVCEAKKFPEKMDHWHYQAQNYAFNLRLWVSVLFNFDELHLFAVGGKPSRERPFSPAPGWRLWSYNYLDLAQQIWNLLSREAVAGGSLERFVQQLPKVSSRGAKQLWLIKPDRNRAVDVEFLQYLEQERARLARCLVRDNPQIKWGADDLNEGIQRTIDRLLFQRVCEDREIDTFQTLRESVHRWDASGRRKHGLWPTIVSNYPHLRAAFNGGLYGRAGQSAHFTERCVVDDHWLENFIEEIAGEDSSYLFDQIPIEILGSVYERFLGSTVDAKGRVSQKPEIRKQGGVFYTPSHIVRYIVEKSLDPLVRGKTPEQIRKLRIVDPACGSGTFLIAALERLVQSCVEYYMARPGERDPRAVYVDHNNDLRLTSEFKKRLAVDCIYGVDIDPQAVEVAEMSLYLKILEGESNSSLGRQRKLFPNETFLPDLSANLKVGNSLIDLDAYKLLPGRELESAKPFSWEKEFPGVWKRGRFDAVLGNPPYDVLEKDRGEASWPHDLFREYLARTERLDAAKGGKLNLFRFFLIQALQLVRVGGHVGMIVPMSILADISCRATRLSFLEHTEAVDVDAFPQKDNKNHRVFYDAKLSTAILTSSRRQESKRRSDPEIRLRVYPRNSFIDNPKHAVLHRSELTVLDAEVMPIPVCDQQAWALAQRLHRSNSTVGLGTVAGLSITRGEINQTIYRKFITSDPQHARLLKGAEVGSYRIRSKLSQGEVEWFNVAKFKKDGHDVPAQVAERRLAIQRITGVDERRRIVAAMAEPGWLFADSTNSIVVSSECEYAPEYILGLLNSRLFQWRFKITSTNNNVGTNELQALPFRIIQSDDDADAEAYAIIVSAVRTALRSGGKIEEAASERARAAGETALAHAMNLVDEQVDRLYGLTDDETEMVRSASIIPQMPPLGEATWAVPA